MYHYHQPHIKAGFCEMEFSAMGKNMRFRFCVCVSVVAKMCATTIIHIKPTITALPDTSETLFVLCVCDLGELSL